MQNKANLMVSQMNVSYVKTKNYEQKTTNCKTTKQTQSKPIYGEHNRTTCGELVEPFMVSLPALSLSNGSNQQSQFPGHRRAGKPQPGAAVPH
jgi:hypothetical protein